ncbi:metallophosphoesterase family protein [Lacrimispora sp.]|uniref:metallophosphoesterase family protein n=1 Tax=Lacrimispora sp. TaxID=2719234 RepID=UPI00289CE469|nr:metallophosphoesterase family protein [Lacrimispora sp.]
MKLLVISDIHSNIWALKTILDTVKNFDLLCCAGDLVDYGTAPAEAVDLLRQCSSQKLVQGNHDIHTVNIWKQDKYWNVPSQEYKWVHHNCRKLDEDRIHYLEQLPLHLTFEADGYVYMIQHQYDQTYGVIESRQQFDEYWKKYAAPEYGAAQKRRMIFGHSHRQCIHVLDQDMLWINPGSASYRRPDDSDKTAHYALIENGEIRLCRVPYDRGCLLEEAEKLNRIHGMMTTELQDFFFFFGDAKTSRDPLPSEHKK